MGSELKFTSSKMRALVLISFVFSFSNSFAQTKGVREFIPKDYDTLYGGFVKGDLNKDGIDDVVLALFHKMENEDIEKVDTDSIPSRLLVILFGRSGGYVQSALSAAALIASHS